MASGGFRAFKFLINSKSLRLNLKKICVDFHSYFCIFHTYFFFTYNVIWDPKWFIWSELGASTLHFFYTRCLKENWHVISPKGFMDTHTTRSLRPPTIVGWTMVVGPTPAWGFELTTTSPMCHDSHHYTKAVVPSAIMNYRLQHTTCSENVTSFWWMITLING